MNDGVVTASNEGNAGGITAQNKSTIENCVNIGEVKANEGYAGGIAAVNDADKDDDDDDDDYKGLIKECGVYSPDFFEEEAGDDGEEYKIGEMFYEDENYETRVSLDIPETSYERLAFEAKKYAGGVVAVNYAKIEDCEVRYVEVSNTKNSNKDSAVGIFAGINKREDDDKEGTIILAPGQSTEGTEAYSKVNRAAVGGVAGINEGTIEGAGPKMADGTTDRYIPSSIIYINEYLDETSLANLGGVTGVNRGSISDVSVKGTIKGDLGDYDIGYGGVAGINGYTDKEKAEKKNNALAIDNCSFDGTVRASGTGSGIARIGGIAGINGYNGTVEHSAIGVLDDYINRDGTRSMTKIYAGNVEATDGTSPINANNKDNLRIDVIYTPADTVSYSYVGGMAGENRGLIEECDNYPVSKDRVEFNAFTSIMGGIAGYNFDEGIVRGTKDVHTTSGEHWTIEARGADNLSGNGGIMGITTSPENLQYLDNYAAVTCRVNGHAPVGGLVGFIGQKSNTQYTVSNSRNFADIICIYRAAGLCSDVTYNNISYKDCINYGTIRSLTGGAAGFTQYVAAASSESYVDGCFNHGDIIAIKNGSAFFGEGDKGINGGYKIYMNNCVNTGNMYQVSGTGADGIFKTETNDMYAYHAQVSNLSCTNCRDYSNGNFMSYSANVKELTDCLGHRFTPSGATGSMMPISKGGTGSMVYNNYYVGEGEAQVIPSGLYFYLASHQALRNAKQSNYVTNYFDPVNDKKINVFQTEERSNSTPFEFDFYVDYDEHSSDMKDFVVYMSNGDPSNTSQTVKYQVSAHVWTDSDEFDTDSKEITAGSTLESDRLPLDVSGHGRVRKITLKVDPKTGKRTYFRGFAWTDANDTESSCGSVDTYLCEKYGVGYEMSIGISGTKIQWSQRSVQDKAGVVDMDIDSSYKAAFLRDVGKIACEQDVFFMNRNNSEYARYNFDATYLDEDNAQNMKSLVVYVARKNDEHTTDNNKRYPHVYYAVFTDMAGHVATTDKITTERLDTRTPIVVDVPEESDKGESMGLIRGVSLYLKHYGETTNSNQTFVRINGFGWIPEGESEVCKIPYCAANSTGATEYNEALIKLVKSDPEASKGDITLQPEYAVEGYDKGIKIEHSDPLTDAYVNDKSEYNADYDDPDKNPGWYDSERISFFKEFDPQFEQNQFGYEEADYKKLPAPDSLNREITKGRYKLRWSKVKGAAAYEVIVSLVGIDGTGTATVRGKSETMRVSPAMREMSGGKECIFTFYDMDELMNLVPEWDPEWGAKSLRLEVRAVSPYHLSHEEDTDGDKYDSDWASKTWDAKGVLPQPIYHFEYTGKNTVVAVLDNPEDFVGYESTLAYVKISFNNDLVSDYDDPVSKTHKTSTTVVYIMTDGGRTTSAPFKLYKAGTSYQGNYFTKGVAIAKPRPASDPGDEMADSPDYQKSGTFLFTPEHRDPMYIYQARFAGFTGTTANDLKYYIEVMVRDTDFYVNGELEAEDPDLDLPVVYSHGVLHTANRHLNTNTYFTIGLGDLPEDLVERDFTVRSYIYASQDEMLHMGHYVTRGVKLSSKGDVEAIEDDTYIDGSDGQVKTQNICSGGKLRPGYVLWKNPDGTYDIYYSASLECKANQPDKNLDIIVEDSNYQIKSMDYSYSDYEAAPQELQTLSGGYDLYTTEDVSTRKESTESSKKVTYKYNFDSNLNPTVTPTTYNITVNGAQGGPVTLKYREGSYYVTDENDNIYGKIKTYAQDAQMNLNGNVSFTNDASASGHKATVKYNKDPGNSYDASFLVNNAIKDPAGNTYNIEFKIYRSYLTFEYTYVGDSDPFTFNVDITRDDIQRVQQAPTISENYIKTTENGHDSFTFYWDQNVSADDPLYEGAVYNVQLYGDTVSQDNVPMAEINGVAAREYTFTDSQGNWNYKNLRLHVTRVGTENQYSRTYILPHTSVREEFKVTLKLDTVSIIDASLNTDETGGFVSDDLDYRVIWDQITDVYQLDDLAGYLIKVVDLKDENGDPVTDPNIHYYPVVYNEKPVFTPEADSVTLDPIESGENPENASQYYALINLSEFDGGHTLGYTVQPIAKKTAEVYNDGNESNVFEKLLFTRLNTPVIQSDDNALGDYISVDPNAMTSFEDSLYKETLTGVLDSEEVEYENTVTYETYNKGVTFNMKNTDNYDAEGADTVTLNMAAAIFDNHADGVTGTGAGTADKDRHQGGDATDEDADGYWNSGAVKTIFTKEAPAVMDGKADAAAYNINLTDYEAYPGEYAGKWIKLAFMASKTNKISSAWTDEDLEERATVNYYWFHIPKVVLDDVVLGDSLTLKTVYSVDPHVRYYNGTELSDEKKSDSNSTFEQVAIGFKADYNAKGYAFDVKLTAVTDPDDPSKKVTPMYGLYLCKNEKAGGYDVYIKDIKHADIKDHDKEVGDKYDGYESESDDTHTIPECSIESGTVYVGHFDGDTTGEQRIAIEDISHIWTASNLEFHAYMTYEAGEKDAKVRLVLPDLQKTDSGVDVISYIGTDSVLVQTVTGGDYHSARRALWYRNTDGTGADKHYVLGTLSAYLTRAEAKSWFSQDSVMTEDDAEDNILGHQEEETVSENEISADIEDVADEVEEEASGVEAEAETEDHEDKVGDMEHDSDKPSETTDVQKDEEDSEKSDTSSSEKSNTSSSAKSDTGSKSDDAKKDGSGKEEAQKQESQKDDKSGTSGSDDTKKSDTGSDDKNVTAKKKIKEKIVTKKELSPME